MQEIYCISRIGYINMIFLLTFALCTLIFVMYIIFLNTDIFLDKEYIKKHKWQVWCFFFVFALSLLGSIFIPSKDDMILIYGLGSTIDYIKDNDKAKQLPDKALDVLIKYVEGEKKKK